MTKTKKGTVIGYLRSLGKNVIFEKSARTLMEEAPADLPKTYSTWNQSVTVLRAQYRGHANPVGRPPVGIPGPMNVQLPQNLKERLLGTINAEVEAVIAEANAFRESCTKALS